MSNAERNAAIVAAAKGGMSYRDIAAQFGVTKNTVVGVVYRANQLDPSYEKPTPKYKIAADLFNGGLNANQVADEMGISRRMVNYHLSNARHHGIKVGRVAKHKAVSYLDAVAMRDDGVPTDQIAASLGITPRQAKSKIDYALAKGITTTKRSMKLQHFRKPGNIGRSLKALPPDALSRILLDMPDDMTIAEFAADLIRRTYAPV